ncbi:MAG: hypothetical protein HY741_09455 [Chloroflexi bacterium]|nr:hypothetical protein [Chloroflexota bacterium]
MNKWFAFIAIALVLVANALWFYSTLGWDAVDDAYISYVYARNVILGHGLTFNPSERVEGFSNFLWTAMMTPIVALNLDVGRLSSALGVAFGIGVLALVIRFPRWLGIPALIGWMAALFLAVDGSFALWSVSGLETPMFAFLIALGAFLYVQEQGNGTNAFIRLTKEKFPFSGIVFALAAMTRPEAGAVFALVVAHQVAWRLMDQRKLFTRGDVARVISFVALFVPYWLLRWRYYQAFLPNSFYAKVSVGGPIAQITRGWEHVQQFVGVHLGWVILLPAVIALVVVSARYLRRGNAGAGNAAASVPYNGVDAGRERSPQRSDTVRRAFFGFTLFATIILMYGVYIVYVGGDWSVGRFFVPMLAFVYLLIAAGIYWMIEFILHRFASRRAQGAMLLAILVALALWFASAYNGEYKIFIGGFDAALATEARITAGRWLKENVSPGTWIAVDAAGQVPYFSELPAIDMFGINDIHIGRMPVANLGSGTPGHEKFDLGYIIARAPKYVVIYGTLFDNVTEYKRAQMKWTANPALEEFLTIYERADSE